MQVYKIRFWNSYYLLPNSKINVRRQKNIIFLSLCRNLVLFEYFLLFFDQMKSKGWHKRHSYQHVIFCAPEYRLKYWNKVTVKCGYSRSWSLALREKGLEVSGASRESYLKVSYHSKSYLLKVYHKIISN